MSKERQIKSPKVGDVWQAPSGRLRIVRRVSWSKHPTRTRLYFVIAHCSWTHRPYTLYTLNELKTIGYRPTGKRVRIADDFQCELEKEMTDHRYRSFTCCDVVGIP